MPRVYTDQVVIRLTPQQQDAIASLAAEEQRPLATMARLLIERGMSMTEQRNRETATRATFQKVAADIMAKGKKRASPRSSRRS
jgi:hypothetical protein